MARIELDGITKRFGDAVALKRVDFTIEDGELFILVGPSGCGKSTLLNIVVGLEDPTEGELRVDGESMTGVDPRQRNMAMVFQSYAIYPHMTVQENMAFPLRMAGVAKSEQRTRVEEAAEILELSELLDRYPRALSGGQRQRVAMGRAIVRDPKVFLLDEPLSNLDAKLRTQMRTEIARLQRRLGTTTLYVTHDQTEAMTLGDRIAVMRRGEVLQIGSPRELYAAPQHLFVAAFLGAPAMNFVTARREERALVTPLGRLEGLELDAPEDARLVLGFRPEHVVPDGSSDDGLRFAARVEILEWLGADVFAHVGYEGGDEAEVALPPELGLDGAGEGAGRLVARLDPELALAEGDTCTLAVPRNRLHLFDASTEQALGTLGGD